MKALVSDRSEGEGRSDQSNVVWRRIRERIEERIAVIERGITALLKDELSPAAAATCRAEASLLSQWLFALDLVVAGRLARDLGEHFDPTPQFHEARTIATVVDQLRSVIRIAEQEWATVQAGDQRVHFVAGADAQIDAIAWHLQQNGVDVSISPTFFSAPDNADVLVVMPQHPTDAMQLLSTACERAPLMTRALIHKSGTPVRHLLPVSKVVDLLLPYGGAPLELAEQILISLRPAQQAWNHVLLVGANALYPDLVRVGFQGYIADTIDAAMQGIESGGSSVVVIGPETGDRADVVRLLRCTPSTRRALIAVTYNSTSEREACQRAGADLVIDETDVRGTWAEQLRVIATAEDHASGVIEDETKPLPAGHRAWVSLERAVNEVQRAGSNASIAVIDIPSTLADIDLLNVHRRLADEFRRDDTTVLLDANKAAVLLRGADIPKATTRIERAITSLGLPEGSGAAGVAHFPDSGLGVKSLVEGAAAAAERARAADGPTVASVDWYPGMAERLDVFVVESSSTLEGLLCQLLTRDGYRVGAVGTGSAALKMLTGQDAIPAPRLIMLELDAMGADGMMILRSLHRQRILEQSQVIVTASLLNDGQLREAFELGVVDVISKPFSTVVLRNRIGRAMDSQASRR